jgi:hypothetical protein
MDHIVNDLNNVIRGDTGSNPVLERTGLRFLIWNNVQLILLFLLML